jgi:hypothetical protein
MNYRGGVVFMLLKQKVKVRWHGINKKHYESKGYIFTKFNDEIVADVNDLPKGSEILVKYICDYCNGENQLNEKDYFKQYKVLLRCRKSTSKDCCGHKDCKYQKLSEELSIKSIAKNGSFSQIFPELSLEWNSR